MLVWHGYARVARLFQPCGLQLALDATHG